MELSHCSWLFVTGTVLIGFGLAVISTSLGVLAFTSSYVTAFPFGAPLWSGGLVSLPPNRSRLSVCHRFFLLLVCDSWLLHVGGL